MPTPSHTPLPWHIELDLHGYSIWGGRTSREIDRVANLCGDKDFDHIANANAAFIVKAVNNYDQMLAALRKIADPLGFPLQSSGDVERLTDCAREAIAKAEEMSPS